MLYLKDTQKWKQFTTTVWKNTIFRPLCYISKILKNESNSQQVATSERLPESCVISQRYSKMKAIHNYYRFLVWILCVVLYLKDTQKWKQFTTSTPLGSKRQPLCYISKILKNESNSQPLCASWGCFRGCVISQRYSKMKAIHNYVLDYTLWSLVVLYLKDTQKWKQFTTTRNYGDIFAALCYISKILKNESNSQHNLLPALRIVSCVISQRYSKMKAIHNRTLLPALWFAVVLYLKDTQKWKQFTTTQTLRLFLRKLCYISKILKNESNSQHVAIFNPQNTRCVISQRYSKMKAIHNLNMSLIYND